MGGRLDDRLTNHEKVSSLSGVELGFFVSFSRLKNPH